MSSTNGPVLDNPLNSPNSVENGPCHSATVENGDPPIHEAYIERSGFSLNDLYKLAVRFHKEKEGKAMQLSYQDRLRLVALSQQVTQGKFDPQASPQVGYLDVIGRDRRHAWQTLGDMVKEVAMAEYIDILDGNCPLFRPYVEAHKRYLEEKERIRQEEERRRQEEEEERDRQFREEEAARQHEEQERRRLEAQKHQIQEALNQQTYYQFKAYAEQQYPGDPDQQAVLIRQLQEQHYQQYMQQVYQQQLQQQRQPAFENQPSGVIVEETVENNTEHGTDTRSSDSSDEDAVVDSPHVAPASMWTRKDVREFKESIRKEGGESIIKVGHGETVTVRVPTHEDGTCLFWEFATDGYDIGFGVYFEWTQSPGTQVSVHISESEDDDEEDDEEEPTRDDIERGPVITDRPPVTVIIPIYRRDCQEEVYAGSHPYPGQGVYLLKFDNSYSLWRSKTLYYRVYYTH